MNMWVLRIVKVIVALVMLGYIGAGASHLFQNLAAGMLLALICVSIQYTAGPQAIQTVRARRAGWASRAVVLFGLYAAFMVVSVSISKSELFAQIAASSTARTVFDKEMIRIRKQVAEYVVVIDGASSALDALAKHSAVMSEIEQRDGHSCAEFSRKGPGEIRDFRRQEAMSSSMLRAQVMPTIKALRTDLDGLNALTFNPDEVAELRQRSQDAIERINSVRLSDLPKTLRTYVADRTAASGSFSTHAEIQSCTDATRAALLSQISSYADRMTKLPEIRDIALFDPRDKREIALAMLKRQVARYIPFTKAQDASKDALRDSDGESVAETLAWIFEAGVLALFVLSTGGGDRVARGALGDFGRAVLQCMPIGVSRIATETAMRKINYVFGNYDSDSADPKTFSDDAGRAARALKLCRYVVPFLSSPYLVIPTWAQSAMLAAAELEACELVESVAVLSAQELRESPRFAMVAHAMQGGLKGSYAIYDIASESLSAWLFAQGAIANAAQRDASCQRNWPGSIAESPISTQRGG